MAGGMSAGFHTGMPMQNPMGGMPGMPGMQQPGMSQNFQTQINPQQSQDGQRSSPDKRPSLKVKLTDKEKGYYSNLLMQADPSQSNKVGG